MSRPKGSATRRRVIRPELGATGVYVPSFSELMEKIGEAIHEDAKITGLRLQEDGSLKYDLTFDDEVESSWGAPDMYSDVIAVLEEVIKRIKGTS